MYVRINIFNVSEFQRTIANWFPASRGLPLQVKCKANAESNLYAMLSRSLYSPLQLACDGKGRNIILEGYGVLSALF